jgi:hypothetical protein
MSGLLQVVVLICGCQQMYTSSARYKLTFNL